MMQHTGKRGFNIIERDDAFSPEALNDNTRKIEAALDGHEAETKAVTDALDARVTVLEGFKFAWGSFTIVDGQFTTVGLGFTPVAVYIRKTDVSRFYDALVVTGHSYATLQITENGFKATNGKYTNGSTYFDAGEYCYLAFGAVQ